MPANVSGAGEFDLNYMFFALIVGVVGFRQAYVIMGTVSTDMAAVVKHGGNEVLRVPDETAGDKNCLVVVTTAVETAVNFVGIDAIPAGKTQEYYFQLDILPVYLIC